MRWGPLGECRQCHGPIAWAKVTTTGRIMPLAPGEVVGGNVAAMRDTRDQLVCRVVTATTPAQAYETVTTHHAAVCPAVPRPSRDQLPLPDVDEDTDE